MSAGKKLLTTVVILAIAGGGYYYYSKSKASGAANAAAGQTPPPAAVTVKTVKQQDVSLVYEYAGRTTGSREVEIRPRITGILVKRTYTEGQAVKEGDILFKIDAAPFEATLSQAQARFNEAERNWKRGETLREQKAFSDREFDEAQSTFKQAQSELKTAQINLSYTVIRAPISGTTSKEGMSEGSLVQADSSLLTRVSQLAPLYVDFSMPDAEALLQRQQIANGTISLPEDKKVIAEIHLGDGTIYPQTGSVDFTDSIIDPQTGTVRARAVIPNPDGSLLPGQFVRVVLKGMTKKNSFVVPDQAVMQGPQGTFLYVVTPDNKTGIAPVTLGLLNNKSRIVETGLKGGEKVIVEGMIKTRPDAPIAPTEAAEPEAAVDAPLAAPAKPADDKSADAAKAESTKEESSEKPATSAESKPAKE